MSKSTLKYNNRELSWLEFNHRVLDEARDENVPLLERLKFLAITSSNLDEFFMVRVGGLQGLVRQGVTKRDPAKMTPAEQLDEVGLRTRRMVAEQYACLADELEPGMAEAGFQRVQPEQLNDVQVKAIEQLFEDEFLAVLSPVAVSVERFPLLVNQTLHVAVRLEPIIGEELPRFAIIAFSGPVKRFVTLQSEGGYSYMLLEDAVRMNIDRFFPGEAVVESAAFRITRNADLSLQEDSAPDLLASMQEILDARRESACVRLEISDQASETLTSFLHEALQIGDAETYLIPGPLDLAAFMQLSDVAGFDHLKYEPWPPQPSPEIDPTVSMFDVLARQDILLHQPYDSFEPVVRLLEEAADDPDVLAIKQTLYRTSRDSPIVAALGRAAEKGKNVTVIVELKARFDEARNIEWAKDLEQSGVQVIYGVKGLKTHAKVCIIVRREPHGIQRYMHFGTGNYNESTARLYGDVSYMTCNDEFGADATRFFNAVTGYSQPQQFHKIDAAPIGLREKLLEMIEVETQRKKQGQKAHIVAKLNSLVDPDVIDALYAASKAGVSILLNVRGICCLKPGVPKLSENITVISIVDRFLEHSRICYFFHGGDERVFISSADWMPRSFDRRVELLVPIEDPACRRRLIAILDTYFRDTVKARRLLPDGSYERVEAAKKKKILRSQEALYRETLDVAKNAQQSKKTVFEIHRASSS